MSGAVPAVTALQDIYSPQALLEQGVRWNRLLERFQAVHGRAAQFVARSPGRVNIIGEHIDYSLYSVLPMAITPDVIVAVATLEDSGESKGTYKLKLANVDDEKFPAREFDVPVEGDVEIDATKHEWTNYFKAGLRGALGLLREKQGNTGGFRPRGMAVLMDGTVPAGAGLSSSAACVSASALAAMVANSGQEVDKRALTEVAIVSERAVGVNSGGMDQSASVLSEPGSALFVSFSPALAARPVGFPRTEPELVFLVAQSLVTSNKQVTGPIHYNLRVVEVSLAAAVLNAKLVGGGRPLPKDAGPLGVSLRGFHSNYFEGRGEDGEDEEQQLVQLIGLAEAHLERDEGYTVGEVAAALGTTAADVEARFLSSFPVRAERFKLRQRALHVFTEALRVLKFMAVLEGKTRTGNRNTAEELGALMNQTQDSCRDLFECSCAEIDELCRIARAAGAHGSRLTGAGWGGASVHLVAADKVEGVRRALVDGYYAKRGLSGDGSPELDEAIVVSRPMGGSAVFMLEGGALP